MGHAIYGYKSNIHALLNDQNTILENGRPKITGAEDFLSNGIAWHVTSTFPRVAVIQDSFSLFKYQTFVKNRVNTDSVQCITKNLIGSGLMPDVVSVRSIQLRSKGFVLNINDNISIPWVKRVDEKQIFVRNLLSKISRSACRQKGTNNSAKIIDFFDLVAVISKSNYCRITIHLESFPPSNWQVKI